MIPSRSPASCVHSSADGGRGENLLQHRNLKVLTLMHLCGALRPNVQYLNLNHFQSAVYEGLSLRGYYESMYY